MLARLLIISALMVSLQSRGTNVEHFIGGYVSSAIMQGFYQGPLHVEKPKARLFGLCAGTAIALSAGILDRRDRVLERMGYGMMGVAGWGLTSITFDF